MEYDSQSSRVHEKLALGLFVIIGLATLSLGFLRVRRAIAEPSKYVVSGAFKSAEEVEQERIAELRTLDTDADSLSDYDELYVFKTSPYLADSDSDGENDGTEVRNESDPNCPKGTTCRVARAHPSSDDPGFVPSGAAAGVTPSPQPASEKQIADVIAETLGDPETLTPEDAAAKISEMSTSELREFLVKLGIPKEALDQTDDATMRALLNESLTELIGALAQAQAAAGNTTQ